MTNTNHPNLGARVNRVLVDLMMLGHGATVDPEQARNRVSAGKGGHGTHKARGAAPSGAFVALEDRPLVVQYAERIDRIVRVAEREVENARRGADARAANGDTRSARRRSETRTIIEAYVGVDPIDVGFIFRKSTESVRKLRQRDGRDPDTGERVRTDVVTSARADLGDARRGSA